MRRTLVFVLTVATLAMVHFVMPLESLAEEQPVQKVPKVYSSPREVFDVYRKAQKEGNWRTYFSCLTPEAQEKTIHNVFFVCGSAFPPQKRDAIVKKYGYDGATATALYNKKYKEKHGIDIAKLTAEYEANLAKKFKEASASPKKAGKAEPSGENEAIALPSISPEEVKPTLPPPDQDLYFEIVNSLVKDKVGLFEEIQKITMMNREPDSSIGPLENVSLEEDRAEGHAKMTYNIGPIIPYNIGPRSKANGKMKETKRTDSSDWIFYFHKVNDSWLLDLHKMRPVGTKLQPIRIPAFRSR